MGEQPRLDFDAPQVETPDDRARRLATDPRRHVALEASAGTGKTRVLVDRYVRLLEAGVSPRNILAITFTRKAAAEMRQRVLTTLAGRRREGSVTAERWSAIHDAYADIGISTIDAFCLSLLREFPLEAGVDPGFTLVDETEMPRLLAASLDRALRVGRGLAVTDAGVALVFAELGEKQLRAGLATLLDRRLVAWGALNRYLRGQAMTIELACGRLSAGLRAGFAGLAGPPADQSAAARGVALLTSSGPDDSGFELLAHDLDFLVGGHPPSPARLRGMLDRLAAHVLTQKGEPRKQLAHRRAQFHSDADFDRHKRLVSGLADTVVSAVAGFRNDLNLVLARGVRQLFSVALDELRRTLDKQGALDFPDLLDRTLRLLSQMEEFSRSRYRLESRYEHVLVDEFQDTSRAQWQLVRELVRAWAAGEGATHGPLPPSIFIVGDRKQSIYAFRDADVAVLDAAGRFIAALRPDAVRAAITRSHRSVRPLLAFVNDVFAAVEGDAPRADAFRYGPDDAFPLPTDAGAPSDAVGLVVASSDEAQAEAVADEIARLLIDQVIVRDRHSGLHRPIAPGDVAVLFRTRDGHQMFERALGRRGVPYYVYKGLGFFDADEVKDVLALIAYLADPISNLRAAALLRSRVIRLSDEALKLLAPHLADALLNPVAPPANAGLAADDHERLELAREGVSQWIGLADRLTPAEVIDRVLAESAYAAETAGPGRPQARENLKKVRGLIRRIQNRGYATLGRLDEFFDELVAGGDESNAMIDAVDAVNLMTVHAAKGLEFPVVFVVNLGKGSGGGRDPIRIAVSPAAAGGDDEDDRVSVGVGEHVNDADRDRDARDHEETKRLLYVALTRARDRCYLAATQAGGRLLTAKGSLGRMLPPSLLAAMVDTSVPGQAVWIGASDTHVLTHAPAADGGPRRWTMAADERLRVDDFEPLLSSDATRETASAQSEQGLPAARPSVAASASSARLGVLVHRGLARALRQPFDATGLEEDLEELARREPPPPDGDYRSAALEAATICRRVLGRPDVRAVVASGTPLFEVGFSMSAPGRTVVRGSIDCLVVGADRVTVLEFKSGAPAGRHRDQLAVYVEAARRLYPGSSVDGIIVHTGATA